MQLQKAIISFFLLSILLFGAQPNVLGDAPSQTEGTQKIKVNEIKLQTSEYVIFAKDHEEYLGLLQNFDVLEQYNNLQAVVVRLSPSQVALAKKLYDFHVYPLEYFQLKVPDVKPIPKSEIEVDSVDDLNILDVQPLYDMGYNGTGIVVGLVDDGVYADHAALKGKVALQDFVGSGDYYNHGTLVAGMIVPDGSVDPNVIGTAVNASIYSVAMGATDGSFSSSTVLSGLNKMLGYNQTVRIVNLSLGNPFPVFGEIMEKFESVNMLVVAAAGNDGPTNPDGQAPVSYPGAFIEPLSVAASDYQGNVAGFSSRGPPWGNNLLKPEVMAPGDNVYTTTVGGSLFGYVDGTSFSSPSVAGVAATLASAMDMNNLTWNAGTLKAAILRGATGTDGGNYAEGMGMVNALNSYNYLISHASNGEAKALAVTPLTDSLFRKNYLSNIFSVVHGYTAVTSHPQEISVTITGNLSQILFFNSSAWNTNKFSQEIPLYLDSTGATVGVYSGELVVALGNDTQTVPISYNIVGNAVAQMGLDIRHTDWDDTGADVIGGTNTGEMIEIALDKMIWVEEIDEELTDSLLGRYDILWIPDPVDINHDVLGPYEGEYFTPNEISALERYVDNGGSLLITFNGIFNDANFGTVGTNASAINPLISRFGVTTSSDPANGDPTQRITPIYNVTSFVGPATHVTTFGNFLSVNQTRAEEKNAYVYHLTGTPDKTQIALYDQIGGGRVIISDNNFWTDNGGTTGAQGYSPDDQILAKRAYDWLMQTDRITLNSVSQSGSSLTVEFTVYSNGAPSTNVVAERLATTVPATDLSLTDLGQGRFRLDYDATEDGYHLIQIVSGTDYLRFELVLDLKGPEITAITENGTVFPEDAFVYRFEFTVVDTTYKVTYSDLTVILDGTERSVSEVSRSIEGEKIVLVVQKSAVDLSIFEHVLIFKAVDSSGNEGSIKMVFYIGEGPTTTTETTPSSSETGGNGLPISLWAVIFAFIPMMLAIRKKIRQ
ncbi:MAG: hypothetical protein D6732_08515 [Methanobacteriota archaeon]|nr:MAG: hypothetical protein D6732_08515 [Euryarchaeota archaeon]